jgi:hypothetical protein
MLGQIFLQTQQLSYGEALHVVRGYFLVRSGSFVFRFAQLSVLQGRTHGLSFEYRELARKIIANDLKVIPKPLEMDDLEALLMEFGLEEEVEADAIGKKATA